MDKRHIDRRMEQMRAEGVSFKTGVHVGVDYPLDNLLKDFHAALLACGAEAPRDLKVPGRELKGIHFAMEFLPQNNKRCAGDIIDEQTWISAEGKHVVIIGGGDTGADCLGTSHRQRAASVRQLEIMPLPPEQRAASTPWPLWPLMLRNESSHEEGRHAPLGHRHHGVHRRRQRPRQGHPDHPGSVRRRTLPRLRAPKRCSTPTWCCSPWDSPVRCVPA